MSEPIYIPLSDENEAKAVASFPVRFPTSVPDGFEVAVLRQQWPPNMPLSSQKAKVHIDQIVKIYKNSAGDWYEILQGFIPTFYSLRFYNPPVDSMAEFSLNGHSAISLTALPAPGSFPIHKNGMDFIEEWNTDVISYVGWKDGVHPAPHGGKGDSARFYGLASNSLSVDELVQIAFSVPDVPFLVSP